MTAKSKLRERLTDAGRSGVYRVVQDAQIRESLTPANADLVDVRLGRGKDAILASLAEALGFPEWFGGNWDALEDSLADLSWRKDAPRVLLLTGAAKGDDLGILCDILVSVAQSWRDRGRAFFAVFVDPGGELALPVLFKEKPG